MANRLMRGTVEFELDDFYYRIIEILKQDYFRDCMILRNQIFFPEHWAQFSRMDGLDLIAFIHKYGKIKKIDIEYTWQHWFDGVENPHRYSRLDLLHGKVVSTEYVISPVKQKITKEEFIQAITTKDIHMLYRDGHYTTTLSAYFLFESWFERLMLFSNRQISKGKGNRFYAWITKLALKRNSFVAMGEIGKFYANEIDGNGYTFQEKSEVKSAWDENTVVGELTKNEILIDDPRRMRVLYKGEEILIPLFAPLFPHQRYRGAYKGDCLLMPGATEFISLCEACKKRMKLVTGDTHCLSHCDPEITNSKKAN